MDAIGLAFLFRNDAPIRFKPQHQVWVVPLVAIFPTERMILTVGIQPMKHGDNPRPIFWHLVECPPCMLMEILHNRMIMIFYLWIGIGLLQTKKILELPSVLDERWMLQPQDISCDAALHALPKREVLRIPLCQTLDLFFPPQVFLPLGDMLRGSRKVSINFGKRFSHPPHGVL